MILRSRTFSLDGPNHQHSLSPNKKPQFQQQQQYYYCCEANTTSAAVSASDAENKYRHDRRMSGMVGNLNIILSDVVKPRIKFRRIDMRSGILSSLVIGFILQQIVFKMWDQFFSEVGGIHDALLPDVSSYEISYNVDDGNKSSSFAVVINTFRRPQMLNDAVQHYAEFCGKRYGVGQVFVVWSDQELLPPEPKSFFRNGDDSNNEEGDDMIRRKRKHELRRNRAPVEILEKDKDSLNSRFEPIPQLDTTSVFMVDDDVRVMCSSLQLAFQAWKKHPNSMVGYYPRLAASPSPRQEIVSSISVSVGGSASKFSGYSSTRNSPSRLVYNGWPVVYWRQKFNIILTKASFIHSKYLELYTNDNHFPKEIKDHVDQYKNCEDIAMSMLVANYTKHNEHITKVTATSTSPRTTPLVATAPPIYVEGHVSDLGLFGGISSGTGHWSTRSDCLTELSNIFRSKGWESPFEDEFDLNDRSWIRHAPGFWWQSKPSNIFEWIAV